MYYVYLLRLANDSIYTGSTPDIERRFVEHSKGMSKSTMRLRPVKLVWYCAFNTRLQARKFENYLKTGSGQALRNKRLVE